MNKFAFQNNARQSHLPASRAAHPLPTAPSPPPPPCRGPPRTPCILPHPCVYPRPPTSTSYGLTRLTAVDAPWHPHPLRHPPLPAQPYNPTFFHSVLSIDQVLNFRVHPSRASTSSSSASASSYWVLLHTYRHTGTQRYTDVYTQGVYVH